MTFTYAVRVNKSKWARSSRALNYIQRVPKLVHPVTVVCEQPSFRSVAFNGDSSGDRRIQPSFLYGLVVEVELTSFLNTISCINREKLGFFSAGLRGYLLFHFVLSGMFYGVFFPLTDQKVSLLVIFLRYWKFRA